VCYAFGKDRLEVGRLARLLDAATVIGSAGGPDIAKKLPKTGFDVDRVGGRVAAGRVIAYRRDRGARAGAAGADTPVTVG